MIAPKMYQHIVCADGATVSIQAGVHLYCKPRDNYGPYTHIEAGFPSVDPPASWHKYADDREGRWTNTVYGYLPWECVEEFIHVHGGMVSGELPEKA